MIPSSEFTGERFIPGKTDPLLALEHYHRYLFAEKFAEGKRVLDIACGEGYGSALLAAKAKSVVGVDADPVTVREAVATYAAVKNLRFAVGTCDRLELADQSVDVVVTLETLEHIGEAEQDKFLCEVKRVLEPGGMMILSTPERVEYNREREAPNEFHKRELTLEELRAKLAPHFKHIHVLGQRPITISALWQLDRWSSDAFRAYIRDGLAKAPDQLPKFARPLYLLVCCSDVPIAAELLVNSLYYDVKEVERIHDIAGWAKKVDAELKERSEYLARLQKEFEERSVWAKALNQELDSARAAYKKLSVEFEQRSHWAKKLNAELEACTTWVQSLVKESSERNAYLAKLQKDFDERSAWALKLKQELEARNAYLGKLQKEFEERSTWALSLKKELEERNGYLGKLQKEFEERSAWAVSLNEQLSKASENLAAAQHRIQELQLWGEMLEKQLTDITSSLVYKGAAVIGLLPKYRGTSSEG